MAKLRVDILSQLLTFVRLQGELVFAAELSAPWGLTFEPGLSYFHVLTAGRATLHLADRPPLDLATGDLLLIVDGGGHWLEGGGGAPISAEALLSERADPDQLIFRHGGGGTGATLITGAFRFEAGASLPLIDSLPSVLRLSQTDRLGEGGWLEGISHFLLLEAQTPYPGAALMISRLIDVIVIRALRTWVKIAPAESRGRLGALTDLRISRALNAIHADVQRRWTVAELAKIAGMSRSSFADRFAALVGEPPMHYQTRWRLNLARNLLAQGNLLVSEASRRVGYDSVAAFSRAFRLAHGYSPVEAKKV